MGITHGHLTICGYNAWSYDHIVVMPSPALPPACASATVPLLGAAGGATAPYGRQTCGRRKIAISMGDAQEGAWLLVISASHPRQTLPKYLRSGLRELAMPARKPWPHGAIFRHSWELR